LLLAELAALQRQHGATLLDYLDAIYARYGYYGNLLTSMVMTGAEGVTNIEKIQQTLRQQPPTKIAGYAVTQLIDHWDETGVHGPFVSDTDRASRNMLVFHLENGARVVIRPSGTEPKNKIYIEVPTPPVGPQASGATLARSKTQTDAVAQQIADDFSRHMLAIIGVHLPDYALRLSGLLPLDKRLDFVERFIPTFETRAQVLCQGESIQQDVSRWIDTSLASYGKDARGLVREALMAYIHAERQKAKERREAEAKQRQQCLDAMETVFFAAST
jgi:hypothetical protein